MPWWKGAGEVQLSAEEQDAQAKIFAELDQNKDGVIDAEELKAAVSRLGLPASASYLGDLLQQCDADGDGRVDFREFQRYVAAREAAMRAAFRRLDLDGNGSIGPAELHGAVRSVGAAVSGSDVERMVGLLDADNDGSISYDEFRRFVCMLPPSQMTLDGIVRGWVECADYVEGVEYRLTLAPPRDPLQRLLAGGIAGGISRTVTAPLERLRTLMMADARHVRIGATLRAMWANGGFLGLWKGNLASVVKTVPSSAIQYAVYDTISKDWMVPADSGGDGRGAQLSTAQRAAAGCISGGAAALAVYPLEVLRTHVTVGNHATKPGSSYVSVARDIVRAQGLAGMYQGFTPGMANAVVTSGIAFATYEALTTAYRGKVERQVSSGERGVIAGAAAVVVMTATMPLEVLMRRMQVQGSPGFPMRYTSTLDCARQILAKEGVTAFWRGTISSYLKVVPSIASVRFLYEAISKEMGVGGLRRYRTQEHG